MTGEQVAGRFRIVEEIGSGGFSVVYRAHQESMNRFVALKILKSTAATDEKTVERFRREALFASHLSHPNTIRLYDYGHTEDGRCFIAMELLKGEDLANALRNAIPLQLHRVWSILAQCCRSLAEAHRLGLVHRDLKPENIFLVDQPDGRDFVKVLDFGVSKLVSNFDGHSPRTIAPLTQKGTVFGTPLYMAPEQAMDQTITAAVDVYALGHIAYEMITGRSIYGDETSAMDVMLRQINDPPLQLPAPYDRTPFAQLIVECTRKDPRRRIQNARQLLERLLSDAFLPYMDDDVSARQRAMWGTPVLGQAASGRVRALHTLESSPVLAASSPPERAGGGAPAAPDEIAPEEIAPEAHPAPEDEEIEAVDESEVAFDIVLGFLAELGDSVPLELWTLARARVLPPRYMALADFVIEQAQRFGIAERAQLKHPVSGKLVESLRFCQPGFIEDLRENFDQWINPQTTHAELATLLLDFYGSPSGPALERVVEHLCRADQHQRAMTILWTAGQEAMARGEFRAARDDFRQLLALQQAHPCAESAPQPLWHIAQVWVLCAEAHAALGEFGAAQDALTHAVDPQLAAEPALRGRAFKRLGDLAAGQQRHDLARTHYRLARDCFREAKHPDAFVAAIGAMGYCALMDAKSSEASELLELAIERAQRLKNELLEARLDRFMARVRLQSANPADAHAHLTHALAVFQAQALDLEVAETLVDLGRVNLARADFHAALKAFERAAALHDSAEAVRQQQTRLSRPDAHPGSPGGEPMDIQDAAEVGAAHALAALDELQQASAGYARVYARASAKENRLQRAQLRLYLGDAHLAQGAFASAKEHYELAQSLARRVGHTQLWVDASVRMAYLSFDAGQPHEAFALLGQTMQQAQSAGDEDAEIIARAHVIYLQLVQHGFRARSAAFGPLVARSKAQGLQRAQILCEYFNAELHAARGEWEAAGTLLSAVRRGAGALSDYALLWLTAHHEAALHARPHAIDPIRGVAIGALVPPCTGARRAQTYRGAGRAQ